ncbi:MAG: carbohydrate kinase [Eggerthellaceae bacterium]|nr:carbohydrate kinase [Eggerthellaceae bacterium]
MKYILGIDVGTSNIKTVLFDEYGKEVYIASKKSETISSENHETEQNMLLIWKKVKACIKEVIENSNASKNDIIGLGVTGQGEGCWLIDEEGEPVQNAILWCDGRCVEEIDKITVEEPEIGEFFYKTTGTYPLTGTQMMQLKWMKNHRKDVLDSAQHLLFCKDWVRYKITGKINNELTDAITSIVDVRNEKINDELLRKLDLYDYRSYIPDPVRSDEVVGTVSDAFAAEVGLSQGIPVIAGAIDVAATALGLGAIHKNDACVILGTTCAGEIILDKNDCDFGAPNTRYEKHPLGELFIELQPTLNGTPNIDWMNKNIAGTNDFAEIDKIVDSAKVGCGGVVYHPYLSTAGERAPFVHSYARASFFGISQVTEKKDLIRAVYEGLSLSIRDCLHNVDRCGTIYLAGGGAKSPVWCQMISDVMGMKIMVPAGGELGAKGIALMVGVSQGLYKNYEEAVNKACKFIHHYEPNPINVKKYDLLFELYNDLRLHYEQIWTHRHMMNKKIKAIKEA